MRFCRVTNRNYKLLISERAIFLATMGSHESSEEAKTRKQTSAQPPNKGLNAVPSLRQRIYHMIEDLAQLLDVDNSKEQPVKKNLGPKLNDIKFNVDLSK